MWKNVWLLFSKEIVGAVRDRRTLFFTVLFPLLFYPLLLTVMGRFTSAEKTRVEQTVPTVIVVDLAKDPGFADHLTAATALRPRFASDRGAGLADLKARAGQVMMVVERQSGSTGAGLHVTLAYDQTDQAAAVAASRVRDFLETYLKDVLRAKLDVLGYKLDQLSPPLTFAVEDTASGESVGRMVMSRLLPYFMLLAILTGSMGLGAEITAGEKERGTIATLLVSQLSRTQIVLGKFFTILAVSLVSSVLSAIGLLVGMRLAGGGLVSATVGSAPSGLAFTLGPSALGWMVVVLVPLAVILSALVLIVGSFARNQKEASAYLMPAYMVIVLVGIVSMTGGVSFTGTRFLIPVANALYVLQEIIGGQMQPVHLVYTFAANAVCGALLIVASIYVFRREGVLFRS